VRLGPRAQRYRDLLGAAAPRAVVEEPPDSMGWSMQRLTFDAIEVATSAVLALAPEVEVLAPAELRESVANAGRAVVQRHSP